MDGTPIRNFLFVVVAATAFTLASCGQALKTGKQRAPGLSNTLGDPAAGGAQGGGEVVDSAGFFIKAQDPTGVVLTKKLHKTARAFGASLTYPVADLATELDTECKIPDGTTGAAADIHCILEIEELDLFFNPIPIQIHVPSDMCTYVKEIPYFFYAYEPGSGPAETSHEVLADGTIVDVSNTVAGEPVCNFSYTSLDGPNCCLGTFNQRVTTFTDATTSTTTSTTVAWGGTVNACLTGPAMRTQTLSPQGAPLPTVTYVEGAGINKTYTIPAARGQQVLQTLVTSNLWAASFYEPADHGGLLTSKPFPLRTIQPNVPNALNISPADHYEVQCLDRAEDLKARIRYQIRDWNQETISATSNPDIGGDDPNFPGASYNDRLDWEDIELTGFDYPTSLI